MELLVKGWGLISKMRQNEEETSRYNYAFGFSHYIVSQCTKVDLEEGVSKRMILQHNYLAITTKDDLPGEVEVQYSILGNSGHNEVKNRAAFYSLRDLAERTFLVAYDSIVGRSSGKRVF